MTLRKCGCGAAITTKNAERPKRMSFGERDFLYFNCPQCKTTLVITKKEKV